MTSTKLINELKKLLVDNERHFTDIDDWFKFNMLQLVPSGFVLIPMS